jgi:hypothetical protein
MRWLLLHYNLTQFLEPPYTVAGFNEKAWMALTNRSIGP